MIEILKISLIAYMFCALGRNGLIFTPYQKLIAKLPDWLSWPLGKCFKCFTGQVMLWVFIFTHKFDLVELLFFISAGIMVSMVWDKLYRFLDEDR
jgi:hypothetical protein